MSPNSFAHAENTGKGSLLAKGMLPTRKCGLGPGGRFSMGARVTWISLSRVSPWLGGHHFNCDKAIDRLPRLRPHWGGGLLQLSTYGCHCCPIRLPEHDAETVRRE